MHFWVRKGGLKEELSNGRAKFCPCIDASWILGGNSTTTPSKIKTPTSDLRNYGGTMWDFSITTISIHHVQRVTGSLPLRSKPLRTCGSSLAPPRHVQITAVALQPPEFCKLSARVKKMLSWSFNKCQFSFTVPAFLWLTIVVLNITKHPKYPNHHPAFTGHCKN